MKIPDKLKGVEIFSLLEVPYYSQINNRREPMRSCNISACAMAVKFIKPKVFDGDDDYADLLRQYGDTTNHDAHTQMLRSLKIETEFSYSLGYDDLSESLRNNKPVVIGVYHRGNLDAPTGGHMITIIGEYSEGFIGHDPFGKPFGYQSDDGSFCLLPYQSLNPRWLTVCNRGSARTIESTGWGRLFH